MEHRAPVILPRPEHCISRRNIDHDSLKVLYRLASHGFKGYLVGGGVRDLLLRRQPKDFDLSTDAHPAQIKKLFRNCVLIGRRFRLAHIRFGDKIIETSTFRRRPDIDVDPDDPEADLFRRSDNTFGTPEEDAFRRDFTINGLFYDIETFDVIDNVGGLKDLEKGIVRSIGDPNIRFREDPVRMLRAVRFASRLGFEIEPHTYHAIRKHHREIEKAPPSRLLEEVYRLFGFQSGQKAFQLLKKTGLMASIFPELDAFLDANRDALWPYLAALDSGNSVTGDELTPCLMFGSLFYAPFRSQVRQAKESGQHFAYADIARDLIQPASQRCQMPRREVAHLIKAFAAQQRLEPARRRRRFSRAKFVEQNTFPEALALYEIHLKATNGNMGAIKPWFDLYDEFRAAQNRGHAHPKSEPDRKPRPKRRRRRRKPKDQAAHEGRDKPQD